MSGHAVYRSVTSKLRSEDITIQYKHTIHLQYNNSSVCSYQFSDHIVYMIPLANKHIGASNFRSIFYYIWPPDSKDGNSFPKSALEQNNFGQSTPEQVLRYKTNTGLSFFTLLTYRNNNFYIVLKLISLNKFKKRITN